MTDLEIVKSCAEKMGFKWVDAWQAVERADGSCWLYCPLADDAQAMALVKKFSLEIFTNLHDGYWSVMYATDNDYRVFNKDLNRAICECVAKLPS